MGRFVGNDRNNSLTGTPQGDLVSGHGGDDRLYGGRGDDLMFGGDGNDRIAGGRGHDDISSGSGNDTVEGGEGHDFIDGRGGRDWLYGGNGNDGVFGLFGDDTVFGGSGDDVISGEAGSDLVYGGAGRDLFSVYVLELGFLQPGSPERAFPGTELLMDFERGRDGLEVNYVDLEAQELVEVSFDAFDSNGDGRLTGADQGIAIRNVTAAGDTERSTVIDLHVAVGEPFRSSDKIVVFGVTGLEASDFPFG